MVRLICIPYLHRLVRNLFLGISGLNVSFVWETLHRSESFHLFMQCHLPCFQN
uniref:Uncharacterized protein n=1 Tax=Arundo donax TaxID=35708 RepID=A0A0A8XTM9_ARUDO